MELRSFQGLYASNIYKTSHSSDIGVTAYRNYLPSLTNSVNRWNYRRVGVL